MNGATGFLDFCRSAYGQFDMEQRVAGSIPVGMMLVDQNSHATVDEAGTSFAMATALHVEGFSGEIDSGDGRDTLLPRTGIVTPVVAGTEVLFDCTGHHQMLCLAVDESSVLALIDDDPSRTRTALERVHARQIADPVIGRAMQAMWTHAHARGASDALMVDGLFRQILARLLDHGERPVKLPARAALSPAELARVLEVIDTHLEEVLTTDRLAAETGVPQMHFARAFKAATGETPHRFVIARRLERAKAMILAGSEPLAEIAYACGFSSQSHMTALFSEHIGMPPGRYRKEATR
ncbi:MAG: AraC family transcriptional regulator [Pseudomonadota bacterium]